MKLTKAKLKQIIKEELINEARRSRAVSYLIEGPDGEIVVTPRSHTLMSESGEPMTLTRGSRGRSKPIDLWKVLKEWFQAEYSGEFLSGK